MSAEEQIISALQTRINRLDDLQHRLEKVGSPRIATDTGLVSSIAMIACCGDDCVLQAYDEEDQPLILSVLDEQGFTCQESHGSIVVTYTALPEDERQRQTEQILTQTIQRLESNTPRLRRFLHRDETKIDAVRKAHASLNARR